MTIQQINNMNNDDEYFALPALSASQIKQFNEGGCGAYRFWQSSPLNPNKKTNADKDASDALVFGKLAHCMLLEPEELEKRFVVADCGAKGRDTAAYRKFIKDFADPRIIVSSEEWERAGKMIANLRGHKLAASIIAGAKTEMPIVWRDDQTGLLMKCKVDAIKRTKNGIVVIDYKTSGDMESFIKWPHKNSYYLQDAVYRQAIFEKYGEYPSEFVFIMQSKKPDEEEMIAILRYSFEDVEYAKDRARYLTDTIAEKYKQWLETKDDSIWQPYPNIIELHLSQWVTNKQAEEEI